MTDFINDSIILDLKNLKIPNDDKRVADDLIEKISEITCIHRLQELFSTQVDAQNINNKLRSKILVWQTHITNVITSHQEALVQLNQIEITAKNKSLIVLLQEITNNPDLLLHCKILSLLKVLGQEKLPEMIQYIVTLNPVPKPSTVSTGSFFAQKIISKQQEDCHCLLGNLAAAIQDKSPFWDNANSLLQTALEIYPAKDKPSNSASWNWSCTLF